MSRTIVNRPKPKLGLTQTKVNVLPLKVDAVRLQLDVHISKDSFYEIYSDIMISLMTDLNEEEFLSMIGKDKTIEDIFLRNKVFGAYLIRYRPNEYKKIKASNEYQERSNDSSDDFTLYEIRRSLLGKGYPDGLKLGVVQTKSVLNSKRSNYYTDKDLDTMEEFGGL